MRKRLLTKKYLREAKEYEIRIKKEKDAFICVKKIINVEEPFITSTGLCLVDNGYHIVEILPINKKYCVRTFFNDKNEILQKYIEISLGNGIDEETNIPYYDDVFLDIIITGDDVYIDDIDELENAYKNNEITKEDYDTANEICHQLLSQLDTNQYINEDVRKHL